MFHRLAVQILACCEAGRGVKVGDVREPGVRRAEMEDVDSHAIGIEKRFFSFCSWQRLKEEKCGWWTYISPYWAKRIPISFADTSGGKLLKALTYNHVWGQAEKNSLGDKDRVWPRSDFIVKI